MLGKIINTIIHILIASLGLWCVLTYPFQDELIDQLPTKSELVEIIRVIEWAEIENSKHKHDLRIKLSNIDVIECDITASHLSDREILKLLKYPNVASILTEKEGLSRCYAITTNGKTIVSYDEFVENYWWGIGLIPWLGGFLLLISVYEYRKLLKHWSSPKSRIR